MDMITLEELVKEQKYTKVSDIEIIKTFFDKNNLEVEGIELIYDLTKSKIAKMQQREWVVKTWTSHLPSKYLYKKYSLDIAERLHTLELDYLSNGCELSKSRLEWAKENVPNIKMPNVYFRPLIEYLDEKGIRFKGEKPLGYKLFSNHV